MSIRTSHSQSEQGYALISTMMILSMASLVVVSLLALVTRELASSRVHGRRAEAKANAIFAVETALAQLQKYAGPDQRITAPAGILDSNPKTEDIDGVQNPHWTGVWRTTLNEEGDPIVRRNDRRGGLLDFRTNAPINTPEKKENKVLTWLVSGNELYEPEDPEFLSARKTEVRPKDSATDDVVEVVGTGSVTEEKDRVYVRKVPIRDDMYRRPKPGEAPFAAGHYAYWVSDESTKAKINVSTPYEDFNAEPTQAQAGGFNTFLASQSVSTEVLEDSMAVKHTEKERLHYPEQLDAVEPDFKRKRKQHFHDVTTYSMGVLADVREGGLKRDLSAYLWDEDGEIDHLKSNGIIVSPGISDSDNLVGPPNQDVAALREISWGRTYHRNAGPRFGRLRDWARLNEDLSFKKSEIETRQPTQAVVGDKDVDFSYDYTVKKIADFGNQTETALKPLLVEGSVYYTISYYEVEGSTQLRLHIYPRVVMWNPYGVTLKPQGYALFLAVLGQQNLTVKLEDGSAVPLKYILPNTSQPTVIGDVDPTEGNLCFHLEPIEFGPGECLVFSANHRGAKEYSLGNIGSNRLSAQKFPGVQNFFLDDCFFPPTGLSSIPKEFRFEASFAEDHRMILKSLPKGSIGTFSVEDMKRFPMAQVVSCSFSAGGRDYAHGKWNNSLALPITQSQTQSPHYKTRDGYRLRWFRETGGNLGYWSPERHMESAPIANYNLHATISLRTPWENLAHRPGAGFELFTVYTRDVWDNDVEWSNLSPIPLRQGKWGGNPFASPQDWAAERYILFDVPRKETGVLSLAQFQHAKLSEYMWHPSLAIGNSFSDPRAPLIQTSHKYDRSFGGWNAKNYLNDEYHARLFRSMMMELTEDILVFDLSYEVNHSLWDSFFLSSGSPEDKRLFARDYLQEPLPNARMRLNGFRGFEHLEEDLLDYHRSASRLLVDGAFNVHSTSVDAWKAILAGNRERLFAGNTHAAQTPFPRMLAPDQAVVEPGRDDSESEATWLGYRALTDLELDELAREIVEEVKVRAPFFSLADFINRRLTLHDDTGKKGTLQAAIDRTRINEAYEDYEIDQRPIESKKELHRLLQQHKPEHKAAGAPGYLMQGDLLIPMGPFLSPRSDTFKIRAYGDAVDPDGKVEARAWCEAIVQRTPEPVEPDETGLNPIVKKDKRLDFGRRFKIVALRWLKRDEI